MNSQSHIAGALDGAPLFDDFYQLSRQLQRTSCFLFGKSPPFDGICAENAADKNLTL